MSRPININDLRPFANTPRSRVTNPTALAAIDRAETRRRASFPSFDGTMGNTANEYKPVLVEVEGQNLLLSTFTRAGVVENIKQALQTNGIGFFGVSDVSTFYINPSWGKYAIAINALASHSEQQLKDLVRVSLAPVLGSMTITVATDDPSDAGSVEDLLKKLGGNLGFGAAGAVAGGAAVAAIFLLLLLRK